MTLIIIDLSYWIFYRYFATYSWYSRNDNKNKIPMKDPIFLEKYDKIFEQTLLDIQKKYEVSWTSIYLAKDCPRDEIWRMSHYSKYKKTRDDRNTTFDKDIFVHTILTLIPRIQAKYKGCNILSLPNLEADDIAAILKKHIRSENPTKDIVIITNDNDYIQLLDDYTLIVNLQGKDLRSRIDCSPEMYLKRKIILGDVSDNIMSIAKKVGEKTAMKLALSDEALEKLFIKDPESKKNYELNKLLISFESIPCEYQNQVIKLYKDIVNI